MGGALALISVLVSALIITGTGFIPGYAVLRYLRLKPFECVMASAGVSLAGYYLFMLIGYLVGIDLHASPIYLGILALCVSVVLLFSVKNEKEGIDRYEKAAIIISALFIVGLVGLQALIPVYSGGCWYGDWWLYYGNSLFYLNREPPEVKFFQPGIDAFTPISRTPLFPLTSAFFLSIIGTNYWVFQLSSAIFSGLFLLPLFALGRKMFGVRTALIALFLVACSPSLAMLAGYPWSKGLMVYFLLCATWFYHEFANKFKKTGKTDGMLLGLFALFSAAAYMTHQTAIVWIAGLLVHFAWQNNVRPLRVDRKAILLAILVGLALVLPWYYWTITTYGLPAMVNTSPLLHNMNLKTFPGVIEWLSNPAAYLVAANYGALINRLGSTAASITPFFFITSSYCNAVIGDSNVCVDFYNSFLTVYYNSFPGVLGIPGAAMLLYWLANRRSKDLEGAELVVILILCGILAPLVLSPFFEPQGWALTYMAPAVVIAYLLTAFAVEKLNAVWIACPLALLEFTLVKGSHLFYLINGTINGTLCDGYVDNLALKMEKTVCFLSDYLGPFAILFFLAGIASLVVIVYVFYSVIKRTERFKRIR